MPALLLAASLVLLVTPFAPNRYRAARGIDPALQDWHDRRTVENIEHEANRFEGRPDKPRTSDPYPWRRFVASRLREGGMPVRILLGLGVSGILVSLLLFATALMDSGEQTRNASGNSSSLR